MGVIRVVEQFRDIVELSLLLAGITALVSGMVQGYSGFGGGLIIVPILAFLFSPLEAIAMTAIAALAGSIFLLPNAAKSANWREVAPLSIAIAVSIPLGLLFLVSADPTVIRRGMGVFVVLAAVLLMSGWRYRGARGIMASGFVGALTGGVTGGFGIPGGPFLVVYFMSASVEPGVQRANIIFSVGVAIIFLLAGLIVGGAYDSPTLARSVFVVPMFVIGSMIGNRLFEIAPAAWFKKVTYGLLLVIGVSALVL